VFQKRSAQAHIDNFVNSQRISKIHGQTLWEIYITVTKDPTAPKARCTNCTILSTASAY